MWSSILYLIALSTTINSVIGQVENPCFAETLNGQIRGQLLISETGKEVCSFIGIPFAQPPVGELRFKRPLPSDNWEGELNATVLPNMCTQNKTFWRDSDTRNLNSSEDCLYLSVYVPLSILNSTSKSAAGMIWIHGGGGLFGSISEPLFNNPILSEENDIIVAFMQYRVGPLGSIYFGVDDAPGNVGLLDQSLGIKWIYDNVGAFGGNKEELTLFGQSAGSISVSLHALSPLSKNYFNRGIMLSGASLAPLLWRTKQSAIDFSYDVAEHVGCFSPEDDPPKDVNEIIGCMRTKDKFLISYASYEPKFFFDIEFCYTVDDYFLPDTPHNLLKNTTNSGIDLIVGSTRDEGSSLIMVSYPQYFNRSYTPAFTREEQDALFREMFQNRPQFERDAVITHYTKWENFNDVYANGYELCEAAGDLAIVCPALDFASQWHNNGNGKVYSYWFTHTKENSYLCPPWVEGPWIDGVSCHGAELEYVFGLPLRDSSSPENEKNFSRHMQTLFTNFAKTGVPSENWLEYTPSTPVYLNLNGTTISDVAASNIYGPRPYDCPFWNIELPLLRAVAGEV